MAVSFQERVYAVVKKIPPGKVATYKIVAKKLRCKAYRAVGMALRANKNFITIPCHRVVCSDGRVGGYKGKEKSREKEELLREEGVVVKDGKIANVKDYLRGDYF